ncbi:MAG: hypothetical protein LBJ74_03750 [Heliobacteriaceae bacterium]|jgi:hypothetical protein|nr:hypothetical protein [Heliobacteriaceae bacterium]
MKRILLILSILLLGHQAFALDVIPTRVSVRFMGTLGVYQAADGVVLRQGPGEKYPVIHSIQWKGNDIFPEPMSAEELFVVYIPSKGFALFAVTDETEDWVEVIYNNKTGAKGWIHKDDPYKFMSWVYFFNAYGKKYGLNMLNGVPEKVLEIHSAPEDASQVIGRINHPQKINLNVIRGNWALVNVYDMDRIPKTGFVRWRGEDGTKYFFPAVK